jgi:hypothetical protein
MTQGGCFSNFRVSAKGGRTAASRLGDRGVDGAELRLLSPLRGGAAEKRNVKRMTKGRSNDLREGGAQRTGGIDSRARLDLECRAVSLGNVAQLVNNGALLRHQQQEQKTKCFECGFH